MPGWTNDANAWTKDRDSEGKGAGKSDRPPVRQRPNANATNNRISGGDYQWEREGRWSEGQGDYYDDYDYGYEGQGYGAGRGRGETRREGNGYWRPNETHGQTTGTANRAVSPSRVAQLEAKMAIMERSHEKALKDMNTKQSEKFDLILNILQELKGKQHVLEAEVEVLKAAVQANAQENARAASAAAAAAAAAAAVPEGCNGCGRSGGACGSGNGGCHNGSFGCSGYGNYAGDSSGCSAMWMASGGNGQYQGMQGYGDVGMYGPQGMMMMSGDMMSQQQQQQQQQQPPTSNHQPGSPFAFQGPTQGTATNGSNNWMPATQATSDAPVQQTQTGQESNGASADIPAAGGQQESPPRDDNRWTKVRIWKAMNIPEGEESQGLAIVSRAEPYPPGQGKDPAEGMVVAWIKNGDMVKQVGHSKKVRGHMVMPVTIVKDDSDLNSTTVSDEVVEDGWVTRRQVSTNTTWFEDVSRGEGAPEA